MLEGAKNYLVGVAERTFGIDAAKKYSDFRPDLVHPPDSKFAKTFGLVGTAVAGFLQVCMPLYYRGLMYEHEYEYIKIGSEYPQPYNYFLLAAGYATGLLTDIATLSFSMSHNPVEGIMLKLAANAISNVGADIAIGITSRIRHFRPTATTLTL